MGGILETIPFKKYLKKDEPKGIYEIIQQGNDPVVGFANGEPYKNFENVVIFGDHTLSLYKPNKPFFVATDGVRILKGINSTNGYYLYTLLERYKPSSEGYKRYFSILSDQNISFTDNLEEQQKIGKFFTALDRYITIHQRK